eukprot:jgi/Botrbrau1/20625/Bobra.113_1s0050.1
MVSGKYQVETSKNTTLDIFSAVTVSVVIFNMSSVPQIGRLQPKAGCAPLLNGKAYISRQAPAVQTSPRRAAQRSSIYGRVIQASAATLAEPTEKLYPIPKKDETRSPRVLIAGGGIGGLVLAVGLLKKGFDVTVFERDLTAIRGEGKYRGPIQIQSNALAALQALDDEVAEEVLAEGCVTGDRVNGLCDGLTGDWYVKFDTFHPAVEKGLPVTRVISRVTLQNVLAKACRKIGGEDIICNDCHVVDFEEKVDASGNKTVWAVLEDGRRFEGDILIGADGIWSKVRRKLIGPTEATYSQYTCYTGIADFTPPDIDTVGYRVFLGNGRYFVSSDVGGGKMQWYGFHKEAPGGSDVEGQKKKRLLEIFGDWTDMVTDLIRATPEEDVLRRDIYDRPPIFRWTKGRVALLGDSAHAMQPNLGQGGCMAIEDGYQLAIDLVKAVDESSATGQAPRYEAVLEEYQRQRLIRASTIHGLAGMAAIMASTYKAYLGEGLGPLSWIQKFKIPHPGRVGGYLAMNIAMPALLSWVLGGNVNVFNPKDRLPACRIGDKPKAFEEQEFYRFMRDDLALLRAAHADYYLVPATANAAIQRYSAEVDSAGTGGAAHLSGLRIALPENSVQIPEAGLTIGRDPSNNIVLDNPNVSGRHAVVEKSGGDFWVKELGSENGGPTWLNGKKLQPGSRSRIIPGDLIEFGARDVEATTFRVKACHISVREQLDQKGSGGSPSERQLAVV